MTATLAAIGLPLDAGALRGDAIACTGEPHCNFSVTETKTRMDGLVQLLEDAVRQGRGRAAHEPRRLPARVRAPLGRRDRLPGHDRARRRGQAPAGLRRLPARQPRPSRRDRARRLPARADGGARRRRRRARRRLGRRARRRRDVPDVLRPDDRRRARSPRRPRARKGRRRRHECRAAGRPRSGGAHRRVRGRGAGGRARVGDRAVLAVALDLDRVPDRRRGAAAHGVRRSIPRSACSASTRGGCRARRSS